MKEIEKVIDAIPRRIDGDGDRWHTHEELLEALHLLLENQALAIEGMKDETKDPCSTVYNMSDWGKKCANEALQQAADHLRAQKTNTPTGGKN